MSKLCTANVLIDRGGVGAVGLHCLLVIILPPCESSLILGRQKIADSIPQGQGRNWYQTHALKFETYRMLLPRLCRTYTLPPRNATHLTEMPKMHLLLSNLLERPQNHETCGIGNQLKTLIWTTVETRTADHTKRGGAWSRVWPDWTSGVCIIPDEVHVLLPLRPTTINMHCLECQPRNLTAAHEAKAGGEPPPKLQLGTMPLL